MSVSSAKTTPTPPPPFKISVLTQFDDWTKWKRSFRWYANSIHLEQKSHNVQLSTFKSLVGPEALEIYNTFSILDVTDVDSVIQKFDEHFKPKVNVTLERYKLYKLNQKPEQGFDEFVLEVTNQVDTCGFQSMRDEIILYKIVGGIVDDEIRNALLAKDNLKYVDALKICQSLTSKYQILDEEISCKGNTVISDRPGTNITCTQKIPAAKLESAVEKFLKENVVQKQVSGEVIHFNDDTSVEFYFEEDVNTNFSDADKIENYGPPSGDAASECCWIADDGEYDYFESKIDVATSQTKTAGQRNGDSRKRRKRPKTLPCEICGRAFGTKSDLNRHVSTHVNNKVTCYHCGKQFTQKRGLIRHIVQYHPGIVDSKRANQIYMCDLCDYKTNHKGNIFRHQYQHTKERPFSCELCEYKCIVPRLMKAHMAKHTGEKPIVCSVCQKGFMEPNALKKHMVIHLPPEDQQKHRVCLKATCEECGKVFSSKGALKTHLLRHTGERAFACEKCEFKTFTNGQLKSHMSTVHSDEKPFVCSACGYSCKLKFQLHKHMLTHTGERPYACEVCGKKFSQSTHVRRHMMLHTGDKPHICEICGHRWTSKDNLKSHMKIHERNVTNTDPQKRRTQRPKKNNAAVVVVARHWSDESEYSEHDAADAIIQWSEQVTAINSIEDTHGLDSFHASLPAHNRNTRSPESLYFYPKH